MQLTTLFRQIAMAATAVTLVFGAGTAQAASPAASSAGSGLGSTRYYVSLGDSLGAGYQQGVAHPEAGYSGAVEAALQQRDSRLHLLNLSCPGETAVTMVTGGKCDYAAGSQLSEASRFLRRHHSKTDLVTVTIGANDVLRCVNATAGVNGIDSRCVQTALTEIERNLHTILATVHHAAPKARIVVLNYYNPLLAAALTGAKGQALATQSSALQRQMNQLLAGVAEGHGASIADVASAFDSYTLTPNELPGVGVVPTNVARLCALTWMCVNRDIHANDAGYAVMAQAVLTQVPGRVRAAA